MPSGTEMTVYGLKLGSLALLSKNAVEKPCGQSLSKQELLSDDLQSVKLK